MVAKNCPECRDSIKACTEYYSIRFEVDQDDPHAEKPSYSIWREYFNSAQKILEIGAGKVNRVDGGHDFLDPRVMKLASIAMSWAHQYPAGVPDSELFVSP